MQTLQRTGDVRFTLNSGHSQCKMKCPLWVRGNTVGIMIRSWPPATSSVPCRILRLNPLLLNGTMMKEPGPDHPMTITPAGKRVRVSFAGKVIADSTRALRMEEKGYPPRLYIPRADADMGALARTGHSTHCPYKGDASYFSLTVNGRSAENAVWTYERPFLAVAAIKDHLCFYNGKVDAIEEL
jgi:uncharacterized protein (DUF427 family)